MYSLNVVPPDESKPVIRRKMSANDPIELLPVVVGICKAEYGWANPVAIYTGGNIYHVFDMLDPAIYATVELTTGVGGLS